jgi:hypothetical protein
MGPCDPGNARFLDGQHPGYLLPASDPLRRLGLDRCPRPPGPKRKGILLVILGLSYGPAYEAALRFAPEPLFGFIPFTDPHWPFFLIGAPLWLAMFGGLVLYFAWSARRLRDQDLLRSTQRYAMILVAPLASGTLVSLGSRYPGFDFLVYLFYGLWESVALLTIFFALFRFRFLGLDVKFRWTLKQSTVAAAFVGVYVIVSQGTQSLLAGTLGPYLGLAAAGMLVLAIVPLQRFAERFATAVVPVGGDLSEQKLEAYRAALEQAYASDGTITPNEAAMLSAMRAKLGITERDHAVMEHAVRRGGKPAGAGVDLAPGASVLGKYRVAKFLGEGAYGRTYLAEDTVLKRSVVIKALRPERAGDPELLKEAQTIGAIRHPNVVTLYDVEQVGTDAFIVMEHVEGGSLQARLAMGALKAAEFRRVALGTLRALEAVHDAGAVHRDVKPSNVLLTQDGEPKLADFGIANVPGLETTKGTKTPAAVGTIRYMSPEQARGREATPRSDLYSAAATLYEAYAGQPFLEPRPGESAVELQMRAVAPGPFRRPVQGSRAVRAWFTKALDPQPDKRFASASAMRAALERALSSAPRADAKPSG